MAASYKWTETEYQTLKKAVASGTLIVQYEDKRIEYQNIDAMLKILARIEKELNVEAGSTVRKQVRLKTSKGF